MSVPDRAARIPFYRIQSFGRTIATGISAPAASNQPSSSVFSDKTAQPSRINRFTIKYDVNVPIAAISADPEYERVVVAGREVLKILRVSPFEIIEDLNLRANLQRSLNYSANDVKWGNNGMATSKNIIATAAVNGVIVIWEVSRGKLDRVIQEHNRAVNRLTFSPNNGNWLVSASQDGTMRLWDLRDSSGSAQIVMEGKADAVRDVSFNTSNATELAASFENGVVQVKVLGSPSDVKRWDIRRPKIYSLKLNAHNGIALTVDWHPDGRHLASGGRDKQIKIWNFHSDNRKPQQTLQTMAPVVRVLWKPVEGTTELASCSLLSLNAIQIWNLKRPYVPSRLLDEHDNVTTGIIWNSEDILWSSSKDKTFIRHDIRTASRPLNNLPHSAISWNPQGSLFYTTELRKITHPHVHFDNAAPVEDDPPSQESRGALFYPTRATTPISTTKLSFDINIPQQFSAFVNFTSMSTLKFDFFAKNYTKSCNAQMCFPKACNKNSKVALLNHDYRTSQTWRILNQLYAWFEKDIQSSVPKSTETSQKVIQSEQDSPMGNSKLTESKTSMPITPRGYIPENPSILLEDVSDLSSVSEKSESPIQQHALARSSPLHKVSNIDPTSPSSPYPDNATQSYNSQDGGCPTSFDSSRSKSTRDHSTGSARGTEGETGEVNDRMKESVITIRPASGFYGVASLFAKPQYVHPVLEPTWTFSSAFHQLFDYYILLGDVQMAATLSLLVGDDVELPFDQVRCLITGYIELLQRQELYVTAAEIFNATSINDIRELSQGDITIPVSCKKCGKRLVATMSTSQLWYCGRCRMHLSSCSICHLPTKGRTFWCQKCNHGGHVTCIENWKLEYEENNCATGCGCLC